MKIQRLIYSDSTDNKRLEQLLSVHMLCDDKITISEIYSEALKQYYEQEYETLKKKYELKKISIKDT